MTADTGTVTDPEYQPSAVAVRSRGEVTRSPLITHAPLAVSITVTTACIADAALLAAVGVFSVLALLTPPELVPLVSRLLALCAMVLVLIRVGFSLAMWLGGRAARFEPHAAAIVGLVKAVAGGWWWTLAIAVVLLGVAAALTWQWPLFITMTLAVATVVIGLSRAALAMFVAWRSWDAS